MFSFFAATIASVIFIYIWGGLIIFSEKIYLWCYTGYTKLIDICEKDRELIKLSNNKLKITLGCGFYYVAIGLKKLVKLIAQKGIIISVFCSLTAFICYCILFNNYISAKFGTNLIHIFKEIDTLSIIFNIIIGLLVIANIVLLIILLGVGLQSWVSKPNNKPKPNNTNNISEKSIQPNSNPSNPKSNLTINIVVLPNAKSNQTNRLENAQKYKEILKNNVEEKKQLKSKIENLFQTQTNAVLEVYWKEYEQELLRIVNTFNTLCENGQMPISIFERLIPKIKYLDNQRKELEKSIQELKDKYNDPLSQSVFFSECKTLDEFEKKHKTLCKKYHPDMENGNNETFIKMQQEYEKYKPYYNYNGS